jgi:hypothetical protein
MVAREAVAGLRIDCGAIPSDAGNLTGRIGLVEIKDRQSCGTPAPPTSFPWLLSRALRRARVIQSASSNSGKIVDGGVSSQSALGKSPFRWARSERVLVKPERP